MSDERWGRLKRVFQDALDQPEAARGAFLDRECAGDAELRREVDTLIASHADAGGFLSRPAVDRAAPASALEGRRIGAYRILGEIGRGGMGTVYRAVRDDDAFQKTVALKVVRGPSGWGDVEQRLERERQILARLQHPHIAAVFDGGTTEDGRPYLVMELVEGRPITEHCAAHALATRARLEMVRAVCDAVQYAHRNLVVHRDLKPGNILVGEDGRPKLLDFGIAKLLAGGVDPDLAPTATMLPMMTPEYASPEQVRGETVTTSSDIYSLGVVLYELLTGRRPYAVPTDSLEGIARAVCESEPSPPSTAAGRGGATRPPASPAELRGDLDTIVLKALRKEPARRYLSALELSEDIRRHLAGLPVLARADTLGYRVSKFTRRHKASVAAAVLVAASLVGGIVATSRQARIAEENRRRAERRFEDVRKLANSFLFEFHDAIKDLPGSTPAREMVVRRGLEYLDSLAAEAHGSPSLQLELASAYEKVGDVQGALGAASLGRTSAAHESYARAVGLRESVAAAAPSIEAERDLAMARKKLGSMRMAEGDWAEATRLFEQARASYLSVAAQRPDDFAAQVDTAGSLVNVGIALGMSGRRGEGLQACEEGLAAVRKLSASAPADTQVRNKVGIAGIWVGNIASAIPEKRERGVEAFREAATLYGSLAAAEPDNAFWRLKVADSHIGNAAVLALLARWDDALASAQKAEEVYSRLESEDPRSAYYRHERVAAQWLRARALLGRGEPGPAEPLLLEAERVMLELHAAEPANVLQRERLAGVQSDRGWYHQLMASRSSGEARARHLHAALEWMRKAEGHLGELQAQNRLPLGFTEELDKVRRRIAECAAALEATSHS
jgi:non-specific serine/threonine protein kinase/serine/threonine-protein kinase